MTEKLPKTEGSKKDSFIITMTSGASFSERSVSFAREETEKLPSVPIARMKMAVNLQKNRLIEENFIFIPTFRANCEQFITGIFYHETKKSNRNNS